MDRTGSAMLGIAVAAALGALVACEPADTNAYTLYRTTAVDGARPRIHVATFDANESEDYNRDNCDTAAGLFQGQDGVQTRFWCEKGKYHE